MKKRYAKGFTLIELLATLTILAILAVITTPIVLNMMEDSRKKTFIRNVEFLIDSGDYYIAENKLSKLPVEGVEVNQLPIKNKANFVSGKIIQNDNNQILSEYITDGRYCAYGTKGNIIVSKNCSSLDITPPNVVLVTSQTTNSITINVVATDDESEIEKYEFKLENGQWINNNRTNTYTFNNLSTGTYIVEVKVTNSSGLETIEKRSITTGTLTNPVYSITPTGWAQSKTVTITYPSGQANVTYQYKKDDEPWVTVNTGTTHNVVFTQNGTIVARISDGINTVVGSSLNVTEIDTTPPIATLTRTATTTNSISVSSAASDPESGITRYEFRINSGTWVNKGTTNNHTFTSVTSGAKTVEVRVTNGSGMTVIKNLNVTPDEVPIPTYNVSPTGWAQSKTVTINYPTRQTGFIYQYQKDGGAWTTVSSGTSETINFTANGTIVARISDGINTATGSTLNITGIDTTPPTVVLSKTGGTTNTIEVKATASDTESGIVKYEFRIASGTWVDKGTIDNHTFTSVTSGAKTIEVRVTNGSGISIVRSLSTSTDNISLPTYNVSPTGWAQSKTVTINYPVRQTGFVYQY